MKNLILKTVLIGFAAFNMGNEGCAGRSSRTLKMEIEIGNIDAHAVRAPSGELLDFPFAANAIFQTQMLNSAFFTVSNPLPSLPVSGRHLLASQVGDYSEKDFALLNKYGFANRGTKNLAAANADELVCVDNAPMARINGAISSFALTWGAGVGIGYGQGGIPLSIGTVSGNVNLSQSELELALRADDPLSGRTDIIAEGTGYKTDIKMGIDLTVGLPLGFNFFFNEPISNSLKSAYAKSVDKIVEKYATQRANADWNKAWTSRVILNSQLANNDTHVAFRAGDRNNVQVGDEFEVIPMHYQWKGAPCSSLLEYLIPTSTIASATIKLIAVGDVVSVGQVIASPNASKPIRRGDRVRLVRLVENIKNSAEK